jgi:hypothetical protein
MGRRRLYSWNDASAPVLANTAGAFITVLDAVLVNGYGSQPAAGWTKDFSGTNLAVYRAPALTGSPSEGLRYYYRFDDTQTTEARVRGYETMSDVNTGTNPFPTAGQATNGAIFAKNAAAFHWYIIADDQTVFVYVRTGLATSIISPSSTGLTTDRLFIFGDLKSYIPGDTWFAMVAGCDLNTVTNLGSISNYNYSSATFPANGDNAAGSGLYVARNYTGGTVSKSVYTKTPPNASLLRFGAGTQLGDYGRTFGVNQFKNRVMLSKIYILDAASGATGTCIIRGEVPGLYTSLQNIHSYCPYPREFSFAGDPNSRTFFPILTNGAGSGSMTGFLIETSDRG